eukprot:scaffold24017_cov118-Isochrysis_galbana.AAC.6
MHAPFLHNAHAGARPRLPGRGVLLPRHAQQPPRRQKPGEARVCRHARGAGRNCCCPAHQAVARVKARDGADPRTVYSRGCAGAAVRPAFRSAARSAASRPAAAGRSVGCHAPHSPQADAVNSPGRESEDPAPRCEEGWSGGGGGSLGDPLDHDPPGLWECDSGDRQSPPSRAPHMALLAPPSSPPVLDPVARSPTSGGRPASATWPSSGGTPASGDASQPELFRASPEPELCWAWSPVRLCRACTVVPLCAWPPPPAMLAWTRPPSPLLMLPPTAEMLT